MFAVVAGLQCPNCFCTIRRFPVLRSRCTAIRKAEGIKVARIILGHRSAAITETYAELDHGHALQVMQKIG